MIRKTTLIAAGLLSLCSIVHAGGWTQKKGEGFYKLGFQVIQAKNFYEPNGNRIRITPLGDYTASMYAEYGIEDWLTAVAYIPFFHAASLDKVVGTPSGTVYFEGDKASGFADPDIGVRMSLVRNSPTVLALGINLGIPIGDSKQPNGLLSGDGEFNQAVALEAGHSFYPLPMYATGNVGYNNRTRGFSDEFLYALQVGYTFVEQFSVAASLRGVESLKNGDDSVTGGMNGIYSNNQSYLEYGAEATYRFPESYGLSAGVYTVTHGRNVLSAPKLTFGIFYSMR